MQNRYRITDESDSDLYANEFEGYCWYSNAKTPTIVNGKITSDIFSDLPFIMEGNLFSPDAQISIQIKHIDGQYRIAKIDLKDLDMKKCQKVPYHTKLENVDRYEMIEAWEEVEDPLMAGIKTLRPAWSAFAGFVKK